MDLFHAAARSVEPFYERLLELVREEEIVRADAAVLIATCETNGINPEAYLADVLMRVQTHPNAQLDDLLPHRWSPRPANDSS